MNPQTLIGALVIVLGLMACGEDGDDAVTEAPREASATAGAKIDTSNPFDGYFEDGAFVMANSHGNIIRTVEFFGLADDGTVEGFNLDDKDSGEDDAVSCGHEDASDAGGIKGIDNQVALIWSDLLGPLVGEATHALMKGAINEGRLLLGIELTGVDDLKNDDDVTLTFFRGRADPDVGTFGVIAPDQTFYRDTSFPMTIIENVQIIDGEVHAGPVEFKIPIDVLAEFFVVNVTRGRIKFKISDDGSIEGYLGGVIDVAAVLEEGYQTNAAQEFHLVTPYFG